MEPKKKSERRLKTVLILNLLFLSGCGCMPEAPDIRPKQILQRENICNQYTIEFGQKMVFRFEKEIDISQCLIDGDFVLTDDELITLRKTYEEARKCYDTSKRCRNGD